MKRTQCSGRNAKGTGPCQATAQAGHDDCARCGGRRKPRAAKTVSEHQGRELVAAFDAAPEGVEALAASVLDEESTASAVSAGDAAGVGVLAVEAVDADDLAEHIRETDRLLDEAEAAVMALPDEPSGLDDANATCVSAPSAVQLLRARGHEVWHADWRQLAERAASLGGVDTTLPDAPYSERTHSGHDSGTGQANRVADWGAREAAKGRTKKAGGVSLARMVEYAEEHGAPRRALNYRPWTDADVAAFVDAWAPLTRGWFGTLTDHVLAPFWEAAFKRHGRYVFSPLACVDPGSRFRAVGDGPSQWSCWLIVSRPSTGAWLDEWRDKRKSFGLPRALRGGHCDPRGRGDSQTGNRNEKVPGAKPLWMMLDILSDYSMPGELVADPTCGGGTLGEAAEILGRRALLGDSMREHAEQTARVMRGTRRAVVADADRDSLQLGLLGDRDAVHAPYVAPAVTAEEMAAIEAHGGTLGRIAADAEAYVDYPESA